MKCITFGYMIVLLILIMIISQFLPIWAKPVSQLVGIGVLIWWLLGFFLECDGYIGIPEPSRSTTYIRL